MTADVRTFRCLRLRLLVGHGAWSVASGRAERTRRVNRAELESATTTAAGNREVVLCELTLGEEAEEVGLRRRARPFTGSVDAFFVVSVCCRRARCAVERSLPAAHTACGDDDSL